MAVIRPADSSSTPVGRDTALRIAVLIVGLCGTAAVTIAGLLPQAAGPVMVLCLLAGATAAHQGVRRPIRGTLAPVLFILASGGALALVSLRSDPVGALALLSVALLVVQQTLADTRREVGVTAAVGLALLLFAMGLAPSLTLAPPLLLGWVAALTTGVLIGPARTASTAPGAVAVLRRGRARRRSVISIVAPAAAASVIGALLVVLLVPASDGVTTVQQRISRLTGTTTPSARTLGVYSGNDLDMNVRGRLPDTPVATVPANAPRLWRAAVLSMYDGTRWTAPIAHRPRARVADAQGRIDLAGLLDDGPATVASAATYRVRVAPAAGQMLLLPGHASQVVAAGAAAVEVSAGRLLLTEGPNGPGPHPTQYAVVSAEVPDAADIPGSSVVGAGSGADPGPGSLIGPGEWTQLPPTVTERTRRLAADLTRSSTTRGEQVTAIQRYLSATYRYTLDSPVPPAGADAVDDFLFESRAGFCEQFAAAEVVLLRSLGVPARMATGFSAGPAEGSERLLRASDAHAWVEVYQPGVGWAPSDPTPASAIAASTSWRTRLGRVFTDPHQRHVAAAALGVIAVLGAALLVARRRRPDRQAPTAPVATGRAWPVVAALTRLQDTLARVGRAGHAAETLTELAARVPEVPAEAFDVAERALYGRRPPPPDQLDRALVSIESGRRRVIAARELAGASRGSRPDESDGPAGRGTRI